MRFANLDDRLVFVRDGRALDAGVADINEALGSLATLEEPADWSAAVPFTEDQLGPPVPRPRQVFAVALNYRPHAAEAGFQAPDEPLLFTKFPSCIAGPVTTVKLPPGKPDWEIEVVAVIGSGGHQIPLDQAWSAVAGLTVGQDLSERAVQLAGHPAQFSLGKSFPGFGPTGPFIVTPDEFPDRDDIAFECKLGGEVVQSGRTQEMIFSVASLVEKISAVCTLYPGDLVFTGTPAGVGNRRNPPRYLQPGETLTSTVEGIGTIRQTFI